MTKKRTFPKKHCFLSFFFWFTAHKSTFFSYSSKKGKKPEKCTSKKHYLRKTKKNTVFLFCGYTEIPHTVGALGRFFPYFVTNPLTYF